MTTYDLSGTYEVHLQDDVIYHALIPGSLDTNQIGFPDQAGKVWHPDANDEKDMARNTGLFVDGVITSRFTRKYTYEGIASFKRSFHLHECFPDELISNPSSSSDSLAGFLASHRIFLDLERSRKAFICLNDEEISPFQKGTISTPYCFELTDHIKEDNLLTLFCDNSYQGWPKESIQYSSAGTDETQTNWNGFIGELQLRCEKNTFISSVQVYPHGSQLLVQLDIEALQPSTRQIQIMSEAFASIQNVSSYSDAAERPEISSDPAFVYEISLVPGENHFSFTFSLRDDVRKWDEYEGNLYSLTVSEFLQPCIPSNQNAALQMSMSAEQCVHETIDAKTIRFGIRDFCSERGPYLTLNDHRIFLRSEANCCVFPETGYMPMDVPSWKQILEIYKGYGVNCLRFHSHCPPDAAFTAADEMGILVQPELSNWDPKTALESEESFAYYQLELKQILHCYANHPSFVMLSLGNELHCNEAGMEHIHALLRMAKGVDTTRLYSWASNAFYGSKGHDEESDFYTSFHYFTDIIRGTSPGMEGHINHQYAGSSTTYDHALEIIRQHTDQPVFSFEVGQYEILPDFDELDDYHGVTIPENLSIIKEHITEAGFLPDWKKRVEATGELSLLAYREEVEAVLRTREMSGISLLGLQDFPGQGTALVGMLNSHLQAKPFSFAAPERFQAFFRSSLPLLLMDRYTYTVTDTLHAKIQFANYSKETISGPLFYRIMKNETCVKQNTLFANITCPCSGVTDVGEINLSLTDLQSPAKYMIEVAVGSYKNEYPIWVYPNFSIVAPATTPCDISPDSIPVSQPESCIFDSNYIITASLEDAIQALQDGQNVFLSPPADEAHFPRSMESLFTTDFWSVGTFPFQEGYMGCLLDPTHPVFNTFPTEFHANWQWWALTVHSRAMMIPENITPLVEAMDCYARLRKMAFLWECNAFKGKLLVSSMGLLEKQQYPEVRAMLHSILSYIKTADFHPSLTLDENQLRDLFAM